MTQIETISGEPSAVTRSSSQHLLKKVEGIKRLCFLVIERFLRSLEQKLSEK